MAVTPLLDWVLALPLGWLYLFCAAIAGAENFFPPVPADSVVAFGSFLAARGHGSALVTLGAVLLGNVGTAMITYTLGRRYGAAPLERRLFGEKAPDVEARLASYYGRFGLAAIFLGRFIPGVRALVPPFAGALRVPALTAALLMGSASVIWYGTVSYVGFKLGSDWPHLVHVLSRNGGIVSGAAAVLAGILFAVWLARRRRR